MSKILSIAFIGIIFAITIFIRILYEKKTGL